MNNMMCARKYLHINSSTPQLQINHEILLIMFVKPGLRMFKNISSRGAFGLVCVSGLHLNVHPSPSKIWTDVPSLGTLVVFALALLVVAFMVVAIWVGDENESNIGEGFVDWHARDRVIARERVIARLFQICFDMTRD